MASTYSNLKFELIGTGEQSGTWGSTTNTNIGTAIEQAIVGMATLDSGDFTANVATLTLTNTSALQDARALCLNIAAGAVSAAGTVNVPAIQKPYIVINGSSYTVTVKVSGQTGVAVPAGKRTVVYNNGTDVGSQIDWLATLDITALNVTTVDTTNLEVTNIKAKDGTASASIADTTGIFTHSKATIVEVTDNTNAALRITQLGTGNALLVEDSANPDSTPFAITATGAVLVGTTTAKTTGVGSAVMQIFGGTAPLSFYREADSTTAINVEFAKARAAGAILNSGDTIGRLYFSGSDGTAQIPAAYIDAAVDGTPGTNDMPGRLVFSTTADGASSPTERMRIDSSGQVKIGGTSLTNSYVSIQGASRAVTVSQAALRNDVTWDATVATSSISGYQNTHDLSATGAVTSGYGFWDQTFATQGATITNYYSFFASAQTVATNNYGFYSNIASGTGRYNFYAAGTAENYFAGQAQFADGSAATPSISNIGDENTGIFFPAADTIAFSEGGAEIARFDSSGNLVVGTSSSYGGRLTLLPAANPTTASASTNQIAIGESSANSAYKMLVGYINIGGGYAGSVQAIAGGSGTNLLLNADGGNVGIGTSSPGTKLDVSGNLRFSAASPVIEFNNGGAQVYSTVANTLQFASGGGIGSPTERMRIDSSGNVGIGTSSPGYQLTLQNSGTPAIHLLKTATSDGWVRNIGNLDIAAASGGGSGQVISFSIGSNYASLTERARIDSSGNLLVGTTTNGTSSRLRVASAAQGIDISVANNGANYLTNTSGTASYNAFVFANNGQTYSTCGTIVVSGSSTAYNTGSDYRLKEDIAPMAGALSKVALLKPCTFKWKSTGEADEGFIAHELQAVCPSAVSGEKDAVDTEGKPIYQGIDTSFLVATLTAAIQELKAIVDAQGAEIAALKGQA